MKKSILLLLLFTLLFINKGYAQNPTVINATVTAKLQYTDKESALWDKYNKIIHDMYESNRNRDQLPENDRKYVENFELNNPEYETTPWSVLGPGCSWYCGAMYEIATSSHLASQGKNSYTKDNLWDDDTRTAWVEGVKGYGIGEYIDFIFPYHAARATTCYIANGYNKNETTWRNNSRVKTFNLYENDKLIATVNLKDTRDLQSFELPHKIPNRPDNTPYPSSDQEANSKPEIHLKFVITEVYKGDKYDDTAISELIFDGVDVHCLAKGTQITMEDDMLKNIEDVKVGDVVLSYDLASKSYTKKKVKHVHKATHKQLLRLTFAKGTEIVVTDDHPFLTSTGWKSFNPKKTEGYKRYAKVAQYKVDDEFYFYGISSTNNTKLVSIAEIQSPQTTYTLELDGDGAFIANDMLVGQE